MLQEYRRFLTISAACEGPLLPPSDVEKLWNLHILDTHDYDRLMRHMRLLPRENVPCELLPRGKNSASQKESVERLDRIMRMKAYYHAIYGEGSSDCICDFCRPSSIL